MTKKKKFLIIGLYLVFLVVIFEALARVAFAIPPLSEWLGDSLSWRREWVSRHRTTGIELYYAFDRYDSTKGWIPKPNIQNMTVFGDKALNTNSRGFRANKDYSFGKHPGKLRILILGDSYTFGDEASDNETYPYYLQQMIPNAEILNLGVSGYGHDQMLILLKEEGVKYEPDIIILGFVSWDTERNLLNFRGYAKPKFVVGDDKKLRLTNVPVPTPQQTLEWDWVRPRIVDIISLIGTRFDQFSGVWDREANTITTAILNEIINVANNTHALPIIVYLPTTREIAHPSSAEEYLFALCQANGRVRCFSARQQFLEEMAKGTAFDQRKWHWEPEGHRAAAEAIKRYLVQGGYVSSGETASLPPHS
jgi:hypothetical protein